MDEKIKQYVNTIKRHVQRDMSRSGISYTKNDIEVVLRSLDEVIPKIVSSIENNLPKFTPRNRIECIGNQVIGYHKVGGFTRHIMQITMEDGEVRMYTDGKFEDIYCLNK